MTYSRRLHGDRKIRYTEPDSALIARHIKVPFGAIPTAQKGAFDFDVKPYPVIKVSRFARQKQHPYVCSETGPYQFLIDHPCYDRVIMVW